MRGLGVILLGCALLLPATCIAADIEEQQELFERAEDILYDLQELAREEDAANNAETSVAEEGENAAVLEIDDEEEEDAPDSEEADNAPAEEQGADDEGLFTKKGCGDHQEGEEWGTPEHDNCYCEGPDSSCYHVDCLPGSEIVRDFENGLWDCPGGFLGEEEDLDLGAAENDTVFEMDDEVLADDSENRANMRMLEDNLLRLVDGNVPTDVENQQVVERAEDILYDLQELAGDDSEKLAQISMLEDSLLQILEGTDDPNLGVEDDAETPPVSADENALDLRAAADEGLINKEGCDGHKPGDQWGSSDHDNCICGGADAVCYPVECLPGSQIKPDSKGLWKCEVDFSKRDITGSAEEEIENEKRMLDAFSNVVGLVGFAMDRYESAQTTAQLNEIQHQIRELDEKIDGLTQRVSDLQLGQDYLQQAILYGRDELRLRNMLDTVARMEVRNGRYVGNDIQGWADSVLSHGSDGIKNILFNLLDMVKPSSSVFGGKPLFEVYHQRLKGGDLEEYGDKMRLKVGQVYGLIGGGYSAWITALRIKEREGEIPAKVREGKGELSAVKQSLQKYIDYGTCPSSYQLKYRKCYRAFSSRKTWTAARSYCKKLGKGGNLAMPKTRKINSFLIKLKNAKSSKWGFWFGLNDRSKERKWKWNDGKSLGSYKYWAPKEPNNGVKIGWAVTKILKTVQSIFGKIGKAASGTMPNVARRDTSSVRGTPTECKPHQFQTIW